MKLTHRFVNSLKPKDKLYKVFDGDCLVLVVKPTGYPIPVHAEEIIAPGTTVVFHVPDPTPIF